jgi:ATP-dependent Lon protease
VSDADSRSDGSEIPADVLVLLPVRNTVLFPSMIAPLSFGRRRSVAAVQAAVRGERPIGVIQQRDPAVEHPGGNDLHAVGTLATVLRYVTAPDGSHHVICQGVERFRVVELLDGYPFLAARVDRLPDTETMTAALEGRLTHLRAQADELVELTPKLPQEAAQAVHGAGSAGALADMLAHFLDLRPEDKQQVLETLDVEARVARVTELLAHRLAVLRLSREIDQQTRETVDRSQREYLLREQLRTIRRELGEDEGDDAAVEELRGAIERAGMPAEAEEQARRELERLSRMPEGAAEYGMTRAYLDWLTAMPWSTLDEERIDIARAREILDQDHFGLDRVKRRILEYLAVRKLNPRGRGPILCLVGPPGVGKTSLGQSVARATGRRFARVALGGVHDESEIRGHRRTYIGALPGNIVQALRKAGSRNPVFMLDELDKVGAGFHGDPAAALLEVLDPEQNSSFRDNYLAVPFDLSAVMFIGTANRTDTIPTALLDRMELIELPGYTEDEKLEIARRYLVARQLEANGLVPEQCEFTEPALRALIRDYTREAGCRQLEREIGAVVRSVAMAVAEGSSEGRRVELEDVRRVLARWRCG